MTKDFWAGEFGDAYVARNRVDWRKRIPFWKDVIDLTGARSVFELGCNAGWNLSAIQRVDRFVQLNGTDVNDTAIMQARRAGLSLVFDDHYLLGEKNAVDLTFTAGVLIHIGPDEIQQTMQMLADISSQYVLAVEYEAKKETEVLYRGHTGKLWKRPFGKIYKDLGLKLVKEWDAGDGFDNCTAWLMEKK